MFGAAKYAHWLAKHLDAPVGAACVIDVAVVAYTAVAGVRLIPGHTTTQAHVTRLDSRTFDFAVERDSPTPDARSSSSSPRAAAPGDRRALTRQARAAPGRASPGAREPPGRGRRTTLDK